MIKKFLLLVGLLVSPFAECVTVKQLGSAVLSVSTVAASPNNQNVYGVTRSSINAVFYRYQQGGTVDMTLRLPAAGAWVVKNDADSVWIATYLPAKLMRFDKVAGDIETVVNLPGATYIYSMVVEPSRVLLGTYPEGKVFSYDRLTGALTSIRATDGRFVRALATNKGTIYAGVGANPGLIKLTPDGKRVDLLPKKYANEEMVYSMSISGNTLLAGLAPSYKVLGVNLINDQVKELSANLWSMPIKPINKSLPVLDCVRIPCQHDPVKGVLNKVYQTVLAGAEVSSDGNVTGIMDNGNIVDGSTVYQSGLMYEPTEPMSLSAYGGKVYTFGWRMRMLEAATGRERYMEAQGEQKASCVLGGKLYTANYTRARVFQYDAGNIGAGAKYLFNVLGQNRPTGISCRDGLVAVSLEPNYGRFGGAVALYHVVGGKVDVISTVLNRQTASAVTLGSQGVIYIGTSILGGTGAVGTAGVQARLLAYDSTKSKKLFDTVLPTKVVRSVAVVNGVLVVAGNEGQLFKLDALTGRMLTQVKADFKEVKVLSKGTVVATGTDGVYKVNTANLGLSLAVKLNNPVKIAEDAADGTVYVVSGLNLVAVKGL